jgi:hypothetical protein
MRYVLIVVLIVLSAFATSAARAGRVEDRESLRRLPGVEVIVETFLSQEEAAGFSRDAIRTGVEVVLQSNGIRILTVSERLQTSSAPLLLREGEPPQTRHCGNLLCRH